MDQQSQRESSVDLSQRSLLIETPVEKEPPKKLGFSEMQQLIQRKREWSKNINIYQLHNGVFRSKISDEELKR
jgi:hypothetical protein